MGLPKTICAIGDSLTGGCFCAQNKNQYQNVFLREMRTRFGAERWTLLSAELSSSWPYLGQGWLAWQNQYREQRPDVILFQGGENDYSSAVLALHDAAGASASSMLFDSNPVAGRAYIISDGTREEVVIPLAVAGARATRIMRGAMGTRVHDWPALSEVRTWNNGASGTIGAWADTYEKVLRYLLATSHPGAIILVGGLWFEGPNGFGTSRIRSIVGQLQAEGHWRIEFCPYETAEGVYMTASGNAVENRNAFQGPTALVAGAAIGETDGSGVLDNLADIFPGDFLLLTTAAGASAPAYTNSQVVQVVSKDDASGVVDFDVTDANTYPSSAQRAKLGSIVSLPDEAELVFPVGSRACKLVHGSMAPRTSWLTLGGDGAGGAGDFANMKSQYDNHPNDRGLIEIGLSFARGYERVMERG